MPTIKIVLLLDDKPKLGGSTIYQNNDCFKINGINSSTWLNQEIESLNSLKNLTVKTRTSLAAYHSYNYLLAKENLTDHLNLNEKQAESVLSMPLRRLTGLEKKGLKEHL